MTDKAKPRVIGGRLLAVIGGGPTAPLLGQTGKATDPEFLGWPGCQSRNGKTGLPWLNQQVIRFLILIKLKIDKRPII
jgi:hypothetical protein